MFKQSSWLALATVELSIRTLNPSFNAKITVSHARAADWEQV